MAALSGSSQCSGVGAKGLNSSCLSLASNLGASFLLVSGGAAKGSERLPKPRKIF